ncbi:DUF397 domain-containing protein [Actinomadura madurae]|uniref:DUF397 domain-containing protein n=1 Tax=Actinomadura madurae TaxID=1993 RepID=A0A1I5NW60_9ACTN|nr:DUF397 domain-containing protein [Actinomadura madurae]SFP25491.1 protein of unknown function [Actinomadura madurae]SPT50075.1 Domain of uncharacterised function (DUF397) [Actinomadura madurae]
MIMQWRKSTHSGGADDEHCVELGRLAPGVGIGVRDSKDPDGGHLTLSVAQFAGLIEQVKRLSER